MEKLNDDKKTNKQTFLWKRSDTRMGLVPDKLWKTFRKPRELLLKPALKYKAAWKQNIKKSKSE